MSKDKTSTPATEKAAQTELPIAAASIVAKVTRDRQMQALDGDCPGYGLAKHKGYGTPEHWDALRRLGPTALHRPLFLRNLNAEKGPMDEQAEWNFTNP